MLTANVVARMADRETLARMVFAGPVLKNRKKMATNSSPQASGNGTNSAPTKNGHASSVVHPAASK